MWAIFVAVLAIYLLTAAPNANEIVNDFLAKLTDSSFWFSLIGWGLIVVASFLGAYAIVGLLGILELWLKNRRKGKTN